MGRTVLFGVLYVLLGLLGIGGLAGAGGAFAALFSILLLIVAGSGLVLVGHPHWWQRHRPGPEVASAPSGAPATFFRRSRCRTLLSVLVTGALLAWSAAAAWALYGSDHTGWALVFGGFGLLLAWPLAVVAAGRVSSGGLWLTETGVEHRHGAVGWSVPWSDVRNVVADEPIRLLLGLGCRPHVERSARWVWSYEITKPADQLGVHAADLAGGPSLVLAMLAHYLEEPQRRERLGTTASWAGGRD